MVDTQRKRNLVEQLTTKTDKKFEVTARMADAIIDRTLNIGCCAQHDLQELGFMPRDIDLLWHFASALADIEIKLCAEMR